MDMLSEKEIAKFEKDMAVFSFNKQQDVLTYLVCLEAKGWTVEDTKLWVEWKKDELVREMGKQENKKTFFLNCPKCKASMSLLPINFTPATLTGEDSKSVWLCPNKECMHTIYNKESVAEIQAARKGGK